VSLELANVNVSAPSHFARYADHSRCFFLSPVQLGNASIGSESNKDTQDDFKVTFAPRPSGNGGPQCSFNLELPHRDDVFAMHEMFTSLMHLHVSVVSGAGCDPQVDLVAKGKHYQFSSTAYGRPSNPADGSLATVLVFHFNIALLINGQPHHLGTVNLSNGIVTAHNLRDDLDVLKALFLGESEAAIRKNARPSAVWI
jgi:hypothetical protein